MRLAGRIIARTVAHSALWAFALWLMWIISLGTFHNQILNLSH